MKQKEFQINWEAFNDMWDFFGAMEMLMKAMDFSISEKLYKKIPDREKKFFKLKD